MPRDADLKQWIYVDLENVWLYRVLNAMQTALNIGWPNVEKEEKKLAGLP
jgi:hypothetical protein